MAAQGRGTGDPGAGRDGRCWPTPEQELLLAAALLEGPAGRDAWRALSGRLEVDRLDPASGGVLPLLFRRLRARRIDHPLLAILKGFHRRAWGRNERLLDAAWPVVRRLREAGIEVALLKGAALLAAGYGDLGLRFMADVDLLVPTADRRRAIELVAACGFAPAGGLSTDAVDVLMPAVTPGYGFRNASRLSIDLHWHVLHQSRQPDADADFWSGSRTVTFRGQPIRLLDPADRLLHALVHGLRWSRLPPVRWVFDAVLICGGAEPPDMARLVDQARRRRLAVPVRRGLDYLRRRFGVPVPEVTLRALARSGSLLQRWEADLEERNPYIRPPADAAAHAYLTALRPRTPLGRSPGGRAHLGALIDCRGLDRARQLPADLLLAWPWRPNAVAAATPLAEGARLSATRDGDFHRVVARGWRVPEPNGTWTGWREGMIRLSPTGRSGLPLALTFAGAAFVAEAFPRQRLEVSINGRPEARWIVAHPVSALPLARLAVPGDAPVLEIRFRTGPLVSPQAAGLGRDPRRLGFFLQWLELAPAPLLRRGETLRLGPQGNAEPYLAGGWEAVGIQGARVRGSGRLLLRLEGGARSSLRLMGMAEMAEGQAAASLSVLVDGRRLAWWMLPPGTTPLQRSIRLPAAPPGRSPMHLIELRTDSAPQGSVWLRELSLE
jgi:hypothetical protein